LITEVVTITYENKPIEINVKICTKEEALVWDEDNYEEVFQILSNFYIIDALGNYFWICTRDMNKARMVVDEYYGKGKYSLRSSRQSNKTGGSHTATGTSTRVAKRS